MRSRVGPYPSPAWSDKIKANVMEALMGMKSGEITATTYDIPIGAMRRAGKVTGVFLSVGSGGLDNSNPLQITGEVEINGTSCLTTKPSIAYVSGEAAAQRSSKDGTTGAAEAVIDSDNCSFSVGDVITCDFTIVRTASPTTEIKTPIIVVEFEPT